MKKLLLMALLSQYNPDAVVLPPPPQEDEILTEIPHELDPNVLMHGENFSVTPTENGIEVKGLDYCRKVSKRDWFCGSL